ncbi:MAG: putative ribonuclease, partial [Actinomycetota bacterium]
AVLHAAQQDLDVLTQSCGIIPARIYDTQLAAGFIGYSTPSLVNLAASLLREHVPKGDRLTDWLRRPLTADQRNYAASDVIHLEAMKEIIDDQLGVVDPGGDDAARLCENVEVLLGCMQHREVRTAEEGLQQPAVRGQRVDEHRDPARPDLDECEPGEVRLLAVELGVDRVHAATNGRGHEVPESRVGVDPLVGCGRTRLARRAASPAQLLVPRIDLEVGCGVDVAHSNRRHRHLEHVEQHGSPVDRSFLFQTPWSGARHSLFDQAAHSQLRRSVRPTVACASVRPFTRLSTTAPVMNGMSQDSTTTASCVAAFRDVIKPPSGPSPG